jgi:hypothetical protein
MERKLFREDAHSKKLLAVAGYWGHCAAPSLSDTEFASLQEVAKGPSHGYIPPEHVARLHALGLIYMLLGDPRITTAGRVRVASSS